MPRSPLLITLIAASVLSPAAPARSGTVPTDFEDQLVVPGLSEPRALAFLPDGRMLFTEQRNGRVRMVVNGAIATQDPILTISVNSTGYERGLQGIAVDPEWPARPYVYEFHNAAGGFNRLTRWTASGALSEPLGQTLALSNPLALIDSVRDVDPNHNSGCLRFGPDGMLYVSLGDDEVECDAQDTTSLRGQILRLDVRGVDANATRVFRANLIPADNPLSTPDSNAMVVFAYGLRNPWSFQVDPQSAFVYAADVGEADYEEIDEVSAGGNYGWPYREGPLVMVRPSCPEPSGTGSQANGYLPPIVSLFRDNLPHAFMVACLYRAPQGATHPWPAAMAGSLLYMDYYDGALKRLARNSTTGLWEPAAALPGQPSPTNWSQGHATLVDGQIGPAGDLWLLRQFNDNFDNNSGELRRIRFTGVPLSVEPAEGGVALAAAPSPFRGSTTFSFRLASAARVRLDLFDLGGRLVRTLGEGERAPGSQQIAWDGTDEAGASLRPGLYMARLTLDGERAGRARILLLR